MIKNKDLLLSTCLGIMIGYVFYRSVLMMVIFPLLFIGMVYKKEYDQSDLILLEFKEFLNSLHSELLIGMSFRNAIDTAINLQEFNSKLLEEELNHLSKRIKCGQTDLQAWSIFAEKMSMKYITEFVNVLKVTYNYSGNLIEVVQNSIQSISDAIDLTLEINIMIAAKKFEFYMMMLLPIILLGLLSYSQYDYMSVLYHGVFGRGVMSIILIAMSIAYLIGKEIIKVETI